MKIGISIITMRGEFDGRKQAVKMVKVRDMDRPSQYGLAPLAPEGAFTDRTEDQQFEDAVVVALKRLREKKGIG